MNEPDQGPNASDEPASEPRKRRRYPWVLLAVLLLLLAVVAAAPSLLSSPPIRDAAVGWYNQSIAGEVSIEDVSLSWLGGQSVRTLVITDPNGQTALQLAELTTDLTLVDALRGRFPLGRTAVTGLDVDLRFTADGTTNLDTALGGEPAAAAEGRGGLALPVTGNMTLVDGRIAIAAPGIDPIRLEKLSGDISMAGLDAPIELSFSGRSRQGDLEGRIDLDGRINDLFRDGRLDPESATATVNASVEDLPVDALDQLLGLRSMLSAALGDRTTLHVEARGDADRQDVSIDATAPNARLRLEGSVADKWFRLRNPATARLDVTPGLVDELNRLAAGEPRARLAGPVPLQLKVERLDIPLEGFTPARIAIESTLSAAGAVRLTGIEDVGDLSVNDLNLGVASTSLDDLGFNGSANVLQPGGTLESLNASPLRVSLKGGTGLNDDGSLKKVTSSLEAAGDGLNVSLATAIEGDFSRLTMTGPSPFNVTLTPGLVAAWQDSAAPAVTLKQEAGIQGSLDSLSVPLSPFGFAGLQASGEVGVGGAGADSMDLQSPGGVITHIDDGRISFAFTGEDGGRGRLDLNARVRSDREESGDVTLNASASSLLDADGNPATDAMSLELDGTLQQLPVALVDQILNMEGTASATLGPAADVALSTRLERMRGPLSLTLTAPNARAGIKARMEEQGLTLSEPVVAQVAPTPEFGSKVLAKIHPIFETTQRAEQPIRFEMPAEGVLIPIEDYAFERIAVPEMTLDFGKVVLKSGWLLRGVIGLGQRVGKLESVRKDEWVAWFTPGVMEIKNGQILYSRRLDVLLADKLHLATWGSADVGADRSNLTLAFMPDTMERVFSITVAGNDALHVPITGPLSSPEIDFKKAGTDLARLRAREEVAGENPLAGALLGAVTGKAAGGRGPVPPASVAPLPWAEQLEALDAAESQTEQSDSREPSQAQQETDQPAPKKKRSTEEQVIEGIIDIFGNKNKE